MHAGATITVDCIEFIYKYILNFATTQKDSSFLKTSTQYIDSLASDELPVLFMPSYAKEKRG